MSRPNKLGNNSDNGSIDVLCANITIVKDANPVGPVSAGDEIGFDITVTNNGDGIATDVHVSDNLPDGITWTADAPTGDTTGLTCSIVSRRPRLRRRRRWPPATASRSMSTA